jgi:hypothetical protein
VRKKRKNIAFEMTFIVVSLDTVTKWNRPAWAGFKTEEELKNVVQPDYWNIWNIDISWNSGIKMRIALVNISEKALYTVNKIANVSEIV